MPTSTSVALASNEYLSSTVSGRRIWGKITPGEAQAVLSQTSADEASVRSSRLYSSTNEANTEFSGGAIAVSLAEGGMSFATDFEQSHGNRPLFFFIFRRKNDR